MKPVGGISATGTASGATEIASALSESRRLFVAIGVFSAFVNLLMLTGPIFMLQVYDRVLTSRSEATLVALIAITAFLFLMMGLLDHARSRLVARAGARFQARMDARVMGAILTRSARSAAARSAPATGLQDLEAMQRFASGPGPFAFFDAPWTPVFLSVLFVFHWLLGTLAVASGLLLVGLALLNAKRTARLQAQAGEAGARAGHFVEQLRAGAETVRGLGMRGAATERSGALRNAALRNTVAASDRGGAYAVTSKTMRLFLQSMMLGLGAWLAIGGAVTPGIMIAASILLGRALAPIDQAVAQWPVLQRALEGRRSLALLLREMPEEPERTPLPTPDALLEAENLVVAAPGAEVPAVRGVSFRLEPGRAVGIAGPSASGKSTLVKTLAGVWRPAAGKATLGGAALDQYGEEALARHVG
ncbi:MAG: ABC transporter transmembrane domain-containing protein, partial [Rhodospirillaceae bacterium]|nr:ABC transporter transmembrane domain-containing protein [Rhodospirillaceae bacterium]